MVKSLSVAPPNTSSVRFRLGPNTAVIAMQQFLVSRSLDDLAGDGEQIGR
jgi:hypothetical protein